MFAAQMEELKCPKNYWGSSSSIGKNFLAVLRLSPTVVGLVELHGGDEGRGDFDVLTGPVSVLFLLDFSVPLELKVMSSPLGFGSFIP